MSGISRNKWFVGLLAAVVSYAAVASASGQAPSGEQRQDRQALEFLGSYGAPSAIAASETGHTSAHPPSPSVELRLRRIEIGRSFLPPWPGDLVWDPQAGSGPCKLNASSLREALRADTALRRNEYADAAAHYALAAKLGPGCALLVWNQALLDSYARGSTALPALRAAAAGAPTPTIGRLALGLMELAAGNVQQARTEIASGLIEAETGAAASSSALKDLRPRDVTWSYAMLSWATEGPEPARRRFVELAELEPRSEPVWFALGGAALEEARDASRRLEETAPGSTWNQRLTEEAVSAAAPKPGGAGEAGNAVQPVEEALTEVRRLDVLPDTPETLYRKARAALQLSEGAFQRAARTQEFSSQLYALRALAAEQADDDARAIREYRAGLAESPRNALLHAGLGHFYRRRMRLEDAQKELAAAHAADPTDAVVAYELGDVLERLGQPARAMPLLNQAIQADPSLLLALWSRGRAYEALGQFQKAAADLEAAAPADSTGELQWQLARIYRTLGKSGLAAQARERSERQRRATGAAPRTDTGGRR